MGREELRLRFGEDAELYDRARPGYPSELYDVLASALVERPRVLEVGCGTGQATRPMVERGWSVTAVELSPELANVARRNLPQADVVTGSFEEWPLPAEPFDLVIAATSWHWVDPEVRVVKAAQALRPGGSLAVVSTLHVAGGTQRFFDDMQACYERFDADGADPGRQLTPEAVVADGSEEFDRSGLFGPVEFHRWSRDLEYTTEEYLAVLSTYSGHRSMTPEARDGLYNCLSTLINRDHGGRITKRYLNVLSLAPRL